MRKIRLTIYISLLFGLLVFLGYYQYKIDPKKIPGVYLVEYPYGVEQLKIISDGNYEQSFGTSDQNLKYIANGRWEIRLADRELVLKNPVMVANGFGEKLLTPISGYWLLPIKKGLWGKIYFSVNEDLDLKFKKIEK